MMRREIEKHLKDDLIPFWEKLKDLEYGGYYGYMDFEHQVNKKAVKGCILNSRIMWFFANAYLQLKEEALLEDAKHAFKFMQKTCVDHENGGIFWSVTYDGKPAETIKHTYNQAFSIYALASYYDASKDENALQLAYEIMDLIETKMRDKDGYLEAFDEHFQVIDNDKLSENGVMAYRTMNTLLHVFEAYTELYRVDHNEKVGCLLREILDIISEKIYNAKLHRQEVFFDQNWNSLIDLHSYGHDIEASWLMDRGLEILQDEKHFAKCTPIILDLARQVYREAFHDNSLSNEKENGKVDTNRIWWVQAETIVGFLNAASHYKEETKERKQYELAASAVWEFIKNKMIDRRKENAFSGEWYWKVNQCGEVVEREPIVEPWKCPYHNGRMCLEVMKRLG